MKGKEKLKPEELKAKWDGSSKAERRKAAKQRISNAYSGSVSVEVILSTAERTPIEKKKLRVAAYCRVSTDEESQAGSYELQVQYYTEMIQNNPDWEFAGIYADEGISGTSVHHRTRFQEMIADCEAGKIDKIITKSISRFSRNTLDCIAYERKLKEMGIGIYFENERLDTMDRRNEAFLALLSSVAQGESENKSEAIKWSYRRRFNKGMALMPTWVLLGYDTDDDGKIVIVEEEAAIVRFIYDSYSAGMPVREIAEQLTEAGIPTVKGLSRWPQGSVYNILRNEKYCGDALMQKTYTPNCLTHKVVKNRGQERQYMARDHHPAIVSRAQWQSVQDELSSGKRRRRSKAKGPPVPSVTLQWVKRGKLKGFFAYDTMWTKAEAATVHKHIMNKINSEKG